jgi:MFS transporter, putative metabolite:H+ symporter
MKHFLRSGNTTTEVNRSTWETVLPMRESFLVSSNDGFLSAKTILIIVAAVGYFIDAYDLIIFSAVRNKSLGDLGVDPSISLNVGLTLLNYQMVGLLLGGILFGIIGDKKGRLIALFGSIFLYSIANVLNCFVHTIVEYKLLRFLSGIGLAGELGAGITIVSEITGVTLRSFGPTVIATFGFLGAAAAGLIGTSIPWRLSFLTGGIIGLILFAAGLILLRMKNRLIESDVYNECEKSDAVKGSFLMILSSQERFSRYMRCIGAGLPIYFVVGLLVTASPELGKALGLSTLPVAGTALFICYLAMAIGNFCCAFISELKRIKSRLIAVAIFNAIVMVVVVSFVFMPPTNLIDFYIRCGLLGFGCGFWALVVMNAADRFGPNLRATSATTVPNFIRAALVPIAFMFSLLKPHIGLLSAVVSIGIFTTMFGIWSACSLRYSLKKYNPQFDDRIASTEIEK